MSARPHPPGTFSWAELHTSDADAAKAFYTALHGWTFKEMSRGYQMAHKGDKPVTALIQGDRPPHWNNYVTVESADDAAGRAEELGGTILNGPFDVHHAGRMAVVQDPTGATLSVWEPKSHPGAALVNEPGAMTWNDLVTPDLETAARFYGDWFGWRVEEIAGSGGYHVIWNGERTNGGMQPLRPEMGPETPPHWMPYFGVEDVERDAETVTENGGMKLVGPVDVPNGRFVVIADPQGAVSAIWSGTYDD